MKKSVGLGLRRPFHQYVLDQKPNVPWFEVITENYLCFDGAPRQFLTQIRKDYPLVFHGVSLSVGSLEPVRLDYLKALKNLITQYQPLWVSDHLCWTYKGSENSHDLLPVPLTKESLDRIVQKVGQIQDILGQKIYLENPSAYVDFKSNEYPEAEFIRQLCQRAGCGLMLDLNNLIVNKYNLNYDPVQYLQTVRNCDVKQIHLAGHTIKAKVRIDTHDDEINPEALDLIPLAKKFWPDVNPMIEWDDKIPAIEYLLKERERVQNLFDHAQYDLSVNLEPITSQLLYTAQDNELTMGAFWNLMKQEVPIAPTDIQKSEIFKDDLPTPAVVGMNVYNSAYTSRMLEVLQLDFPILKSVLNEYFDDVVLDYLKKYPSTYDSIDFVGQDLSRFIKEHNFGYSLGVDKRVIADVAGFESLSGLVMVAFDEENTLEVSKFSEEDWTEKLIKIKNAVRIYEADCLIHQVISAVQNDETPSIPEIEKTYYLFYREENVSYFKVLDLQEFRFFQHFLDYKTFYSFIEDQEDRLTEMASLLIQNQKFFTMQ